LHNNLCAGFTNPLGPSGKQVVLNLAPYLRGFVDVHDGSVDVCCQVDLLPEISQAPRILSDVESALKNKQLKAEVDDYLKVCLSWFWFGSVE
jgi:hypothetical protein